MALLADWGQFLDWIGNDHRPDYLIMPSKDPAKAAIFLVSRSDRPIILEIESATKTQTGIAKSYSDWAGSSHSWADLAATDHAIPVGTGKWGSELRIYFPADSELKQQLERYGYMVESGSRWHKGTYRINNRELFKELVASHGLTLGKNN